MFNKRNSPKMGKKTNKHLWILEWTAKLWDSHAVERLHVNKNDWNTITQNNMDKFHKHNVKWKKQDTKYWFIPFIKCSKASNSWSGWWLPKCVNFVHILQTEYLRSVPFSMSMLFFNKMITLNKKQQQKCCYGLNIWNCLRILPLTIFYNLQGCQIFELWM